jgi:hydrogenase/urease accessory protein HupE
MRWVSTWLLCAFLGSISAHAHDFPLDRVMNAFVKIEPHQADLVIRIPLDLLNGVPFPLIGTNYYNVATSGPTVAKALSNLGTGIELWEGDVLLVPSSSKGKLVPLADRSFQDYDSAAAQIAKSPPPDAVIGYDQGYFDAHFVYPISSPNSVFSIENNVASDLGAYTNTAIRLLPLDGPPRAMMITGESGRVTLDPPWYAASIGFIKLGIGHILTGIDHMLFLLCLVIPFRRIRSLIPVITAFTVGHSVTLIGTAYGLAPPGRWFPPFVETAIAVSIIYMALENIVAASLRRRWIIAGLFGLVHGFGFADILSQQLQFAGSNLLIALFSFNVGIEIGQLLVLCVFVPALALLLRGSMSGRMGITVLSSLVLLTAWQWMLERGEILWQTPWPPPTIAGLMLLTRWIVALVIIVAAATLFSRWLDRKWSGRLVPAQVASQP